jgi:hypothetical protein
LTLLWVGVAVAGGGVTNSADTVTPVGARGTWTELLDVQQQGSSNDRRSLYLFAGSGSVTNETISITYSSGASATWTETAWVIDEWSGQDTGTPYATAIGATGAGATSGALTDLGTPGTDARVTAGWIHSVAETVTASGLTATGTNLESLTDIRSLHVFYDASDPQNETPSASWSTSDAWTAIGIIINAATGGGVPISAIANHYSQLRS